MNTKLQSKLESYGDSHQNPRNQKIHKVSVPLIMLSVLGLFSLLKVGALNGAWILVILVCAYYLQFKSPKIYLVIFLQLLPTLVFIHWNPWPPVPLYVGIFIGAWIAQFIGHHIEGKRPSFFQDVQALLIGPLWVIKGLLR